MALFRFEHKDEPVAHPAKFAGRLAGNVFAATLIIGVALAGGIAGFHYLAEQSWIDAYLNAAMLLGGMGPVGDLGGGDVGKLFAGLYALACGLLFVLVSGVVLAPVLHRVLHRMHVRDK